MECSTTRLFCPSPSPGACWNSCRLNRWCHRTILSSVVPFSSSFGSINFIIHLQGPFPSGNYQIWSCRPSMLGNKAVGLLIKQCPIVYEYYFLYLNSNGWKMHKDLIKELYICYFHFLLFFSFWSNSLPIEVPVFTFCLQSKWTPLCNYFDRMLTT